jgi:hypothetical protein
MGLLGDAGKDAGSVAAKTIADEIDRAIPEASEALKSGVDHIAYSAAGIVADIANRVNGAECPIDITVAASVTANLTIKGKIGALVINKNIDYVVNDPQEIKVEG